MNEDFKTLTEVLEHTKETLFLDLISHAVGLDEEHYKALIDPPKGIYLVGSPDPILVDNQLYYYKSKFLTTDANTLVKARIRNFDHILESKEDIVDSTGRVVLRAKDIYQRRRFLSTQPTVPVVAIKMAIGVVQRYLNTLCRHLRHGYNSYRLEALVKPEYGHMLDKDEYLHGFSRLLDEVQKFVGDDHWNLYFYRLKGSTMIITKGIDFRIYEWYQIQFEKQDKDNDRY